MNEPLPILELDLPRPRGPVGPRRPHSVRRTATIDVTWPQGPEKPARFHGVGRDVYTPPQGGAPQILALDELWADIDRERVIRALWSRPARPGLARLVGARGGGYLRAALQEALPEERRAGSPLYLLVDDLSGTSLVCAWALYSSGALPPPAAASEEERQALLAQREGVCIGFRPGSSALRVPLGDPLVVRQRTAQVPPLPHPDDPDGWHPLDEDVPLSFRRARCLDLWLDEAGRLAVEATFQDSSPRPGGVREAIHEYGLFALAEAESGALLHLEATPHILPFPECPNAIERLDRLRGVPLAELRSAVLETFPRVEGCTHLNDCLRSLAEAPQLFAALCARRESE